MLEKEILLDQLDDKIRKSLALIVDLYPRFRDGELDRIEADGLLQITDALECFFDVIYDVQYNENIEEYIDEIYNIARMVESHERIRDDKESDN